MLPFLLKDVSFNVCEGIFFQRSGAVSHVSCQVYNWLNIHFLATWICCGDPVFLSPCSDLSPLEFFLWGCIKENVCAVEIQVHDNLIIHILVAVTVIKGHIEQLVHTRDSI